VPDDLNLPATIPNAPEASLTLENLSPMIAAELAAGLSDAKTLRARYGLSLEQWKMLGQNKAFRQMLGEAIAKFKGDLNAGARITLKAEILLEDVMPELYHLAKRSETPASERINAVKQLAALAGRGEKKGDENARAGSGFVLNINVGKGQGVTIEGQKVPSDDNG
jgi:hypothetical protein